MSGRGKMHFGLGLFALFLAGCSGSQPPINKYDPLVGGPPLPKEGTARAKDQGVPGVPAVPAPSASTSPASLASGGGVPALEGERNLRIPGDRESEANSWRNPSSAVSLGTPEVGRAGGTPPQPITPGLPVSTPMSGTLTSVDQGLKLLEQKGVQGFRLEKDRETGQWRCLCSIPSRQNPTTKQVYDLKAPDALAALQAVLDKIERDIP